MGDLEGRLSRRWRQAAGWGSFSAMPFCPACHAEYRDGFSRCEPCGEPLVADLPETDSSAFERLEALLAKDQAVLSDPRSLEDAQRDQELLREEGVPCLLWGNPKALGPSGAPLYYHLALLPEHVAPARDTLERRRRNMLELEGGAVPEVVVDLAAANITCPGCGFTFPHADECPDCGLFVGAPPDAPPTPTPSDDGEKKS